jgi:hypothetical protein
METNAMETILRQLQQLNYNFNNGLDVMESTLNLTHTLQQLNSHSVILQRASDTAYVDSNIRRHERRSTYEHQSSRSDITQDAQDEFAQIKMKRESFQRKNSTELSLNNATVPITKAEFQQHLMDSIVNTNIVKYVYETPTIIQIASNVNCDNAIDNVFHLFEPSLHNKVYADDNTSLSYIYGKSNHQSDKENNKNGIAYKSIHLYLKHDYNENENQISDENMDASFLKIFKPGILMRYFSGSQPSAQKELFTITGGKSVDVDPIVPHFSTPHVYTVPLSDPYDITRLQNDTPHHLEDNPIII